MKLTFTEREALAQTCMAVRNTAFRDGIYRMSPETPETTEAKDRAFRRYLDLIYGNRTPEDVLAEIEAEKKQEVPA